MPLVPGAPDMADMLPTRKPALVDKSWRPRCGSIASTYLAQVSEPRKVPDHWLEMVEEDLSTVTDLPCGLSMSARITSMPRIDSRARKSLGESAPAIIEAVTRARLKRRSCLPLDILDLRPGELEGLDLSLKPWKFRGFTMEDDDLVVWFATCSPGKTPLGFLDFETDIVTLRGPATRFGVVL